MTASSGRRWFLRASILSVAALTCASPVWFLNRKKRAFGRVLKEGDHHALLAACRDLMKRHEQFRTSGGATDPNQTVPVDPTDPRLPAVIRDLAPTSVSVSISFVGIELHGGHDHFGFHAYSEGGDGPTEGGLIPGLFAYGTS